ncbi:unnamed protein product [Pocillopora meandrina]|uniref:Ig-like domain-containing protein n=1 Tax=Pocillopora meandrina TaxID=46732 RepID=A0AAU9XXZ7_9CNID|nr:unnamed protein product [Pocillopora meandrina]
MMVNDSRGVREHPDIPPSYKGRVKIEGRATLVIKNINVRDNTKFKCGVYGTFLNSLESTVELILAEPPLINLSLGRKYYIEGSPVTIACRASGKPLPDVAWIRNGVLLKKAAFLKFDNISRTDAGRYTCRANNSVQVTSIDTTISVHCKYILTSIFDFLIYFIIYRAPSVIKVSDTILTNLFKSVRKQNSFSNPFRVYMHWSQVPKIHSV